MNLFENEIAHGWQIINKDYLEKTYLFSNFKEAIFFINRVSEIGEDLSYHLDILLQNSQVKIIMHLPEITKLTIANFTTFTVKCDNEFNKNPIMKVCF